MSAKISPHQKMHAQDPETLKLRSLVLKYAEERMNLDPVLLDSPESLGYLKARVGETITEAGLGGEQALELFANVLAPACISTDHPGYLSFIPASPTEASSLFDLVVSASSIYGGSWLRARGRSTPRIRCSTFWPGRLGCQAGLEGSSCKGALSGIFRPWSPLANGIRQGWPVWEYLGTDGSRFWSAKSRIHR